MFIWDHNHQIDPNLLWRISCFFMKLRFFSSIIISTKAWFASKLKFQWILNENMNVQIVFAIEIGQKSRKKYDNF